MITSKSGSDNQTNNGKIEKYCYDNDPANCKKYGGLYQWDEAMQYSTTAGAQGICPEGWHIPTKAEFETLKKYVDNKSIRIIDESAKNDSTYNETGFSALFAGNRFSDSGSFYGLGEHTQFWGSTESSSKAYTMFLDYNSPSTIYFGDDLKNHGVNVRCLKD